MYFRRMFTLLVTSTKSNHVTVESSSTKTAAQVRVDAMDDRSNRKRGFPVILDVNATKQHVKRTSSEYSSTGASKYCPWYTSFSIVLWEGENNIMLTVVPLTNRFRTTTPSRLCSNIESESRESLKARLSASVHGVRFDGNERQ